MPFLKSYIFIIFVSFLSLFLMQAYSAMLFSIIGIAFLLIVVNNKKYASLKEKLERLL